jgi:hypothetical protein
MGASSTLGSEALPPAANINRLVLQVNVTGASSQATTATLHGVMPGHFGDSLANFGDIGFAHSFVDDDADAGLEDFFGLGAGHLGVVHRSKAEFLDGPATGEEAVRLKHGIAVEGDGDITG